MATGTNLVLILGVGLAIVATVLCIVATAIPYWLHASNGAHMGLWQYCGNLLGTIICGSLIDVVGWMKAVRAMMILAILQLVASTVLSFMFAFVMRSQKNVGMVSGVLACVGGALSMTGAIIYAAEISKLPSTGYSLHAGFGLAIVAAIAGVAAGIFILLGKRNAD